MRRLTLLVILIFSLLSTVSAQDDVVTYRSQNNAFTFDYPSEWVLVEDDIDFQQEIELTGITSYDAVFALADGLVTVSAFNTRVNNNSGLFSYDSAETYAENSSAFWGGEIDTFQVNGLDVTVNTIDDLRGEEPYLYTAVMVVDADWVVAISHQSASQESIDRIASQTVALFASLDILLGDTFVISPYYSIALPDSWTVLFAPSFIEEFQGFVISSSSADDNPIAYIDLYMYRVEDLYGIRGGGFTDIEFLQRNGFSDATTEALEILFIDDNQVIKYIEASDAEQSTAYMSYLDGGEWLFFARAEVDDKDFLADTEAIAEQLLFDVSRSFAITEETPSQTIFITSTVSDADVPEPSTPQGVLTSESQDGAVTFEYPDYWTIEDREYNFAERYRYALWTPEEIQSIAPPPRSRILLDIINRNQTAYENLETPAEFLTELAEVEDESPVILDATEFTLLDSPAARVEFTTDNGEPVALYAIVFDMDWVIFISVGAPNEDFEAHEADLIFILESLEFDSNLASIEFVRNLLEYEFEEEIELGARYERDDNLLSFNYPETWILTDPNAGFYYGVEFDVEGVTVSLDLADVSDPLLNAPPEQDTAPEQIEYLRDLTDDYTVSEFVVNGIEMISLQGQLNSQEYEIYITFPINNQWVASISATSEAFADIADLEASLVATLASVDFALGVPYVDIPIMRVDLPVPWEVGRLQSIENEAYSILLRPSDQLYSNGDRVLIQIIDLASSETTENLVGEDIETIIDEMISQDIILIDDVEIGNYLVTQSSIEFNQGGAFGQYTIFLLEDSWLFVFYAGTFDLDALERVQTDIETIIEDMGITLPED